MKFILEVLLMGLAVAIAAFLIPGVEVNGFWAAIVTGLLLGLVNVTVGFLLRVFTFPLNILTLGLVSFIITVLMVLLVSKLYSGFHVSGFFSAMFFAIMLAIIKMIFGTGSSKKD